MGGADRNQFPRLPGFQKSIWISQLRDNKNGGLGWYRSSMGLIPEHPSPTNHALIGVLDTFSFNTVPQRCGMRIYSKILAKDHLHHQIPDVHPLPVPSAVPAAHPREQHPSRPVFPPLLQGTVWDEKATCQEGNSGCLLLCCGSSVSPGDSSPRPPSCLGCPSPRSSISPIRQMRRQVRGGVRAHHGESEASSATL